MEKIIRLRIVIFYFLDEEDVSFIKLFLKVRPLLRFSFRLSVPIGSLVYLPEHQPMLAAILHYLCDVRALQEGELFEEVGAIGIVQNLSRQKHLKKQPYYA